uniref:UPF0725 protein n=1 Tax=Noccaea caerulescens TaxID=107243 RepID=A0A1J3CIJ9_NOCCA
MSSRIEDMEKLMKGQKEVSRSVGFDLEDVEDPYGTMGLACYDCEGDVFDAQLLLVKLFARLGLHRYNMSKGTKFELHRVKKYNKSMGCLCSYYITLVAWDPATRSLINFQSGVGQLDFGILSVRCFVARPQGVTESSPFDPLDFFRRPDGDQRFHWPSDFSDRNRFYILSDSELQNNDWPRLYVELAICETDRGIYLDSTLAPLQILEVAIETADEDVEPLQAKNATVYIKFKGLAYAVYGELGAHVERKIVVKRSINERSGYLTLVGGYGFSIGENTDSRSMTHPHSNRKPGDSIFCSKAVGYDRPLNISVPRFFSLTKPPHS